jgi:hypothetical protein
MSTHPAIRDKYLERLLRDDANLGIDGVGDLTARVGRGVATPVRNWARWALAAALTLPLATGTGVAVSTGQVHIHWDRGPAPSNNGQAVMVERQMPFTTTVEDAERRLGFHVQTLSGYGAAHLDEVLFVPPIIAIDGKPRQHANSAVQLSYTVDGKQVGIVERLDPAGPGPLDVTFRQPGALERPSGVVPTIQSLRGQDYLVFLVGERVASVQWKPAHGAVLIGVNYGLTAGLSPRAKGPALVAVWDLIAHLSWGAR